MSAMSEGGIGSRESFDYSRLKVGFIGVGNMGGAILSSLLKKVPKENIYAYDVNEEKLKAFEGVKVCSSEREVVQKSDYVFLCVKPQVLDAVLEKIKESAKGDKVFVSIAAGYPIKKIERFLEGAKIVRLMPNILVRYCEGVYALASKNVSEDELFVLKKLLELGGEVVDVRESQMDAVTALSGSSPAFVFVFIQALADAGVFCGLSRQDAVRMAAKVLKGAAVAVLEGEHPEVLKDSVCSPAGTTIEGIKALEESAFRASVMEAVKRACDKSRLLSGDTA